MKTKFVLFWAAIICIGLTSCKKEDAPFIEIPVESAEVKFDESTKTQTITFDVNQSWKAAVKQTKADDVTWVTLSPQSGQAGKATLTISAGESFLQSDRTAYIHIQIDGLTKTIAVTQTAGIPKLANDEAATKTPSTGFYVINEDWFGWDNGTVNYFKTVGNSLEATYRAYRAANPNDMLGTTSSFATIWGENVYLCSKQGTRLVVADAKTLKKKKSFDNIGGDGRAFAGIDNKKGYLSLGNGIVAFDIDKLEIGARIEGISGQVGNMSLAGGRVFAVSQSKVYVINAQTDKLELTFEGAFSTLAQSKDGDIWVASSKGLLRINPHTLDKETIEYPANASVGNSWGAWNAGSLCASTQTNTLYWSTGGGMFGGGKVVVKFDVDTRVANPSFYTLGKSEHNTQLEFYGAGLRVDPLTDELILTVKHSGWGASGAYNWIYKLNATGQEVTNLKLKGDNGVASGWGGNAEDWDGKYFWYPSVPFFEDANKPQILVNQIILAKNEEKTLDLEKIILDHDNSFASIQKKVAFADEKLVAGSISDGKLTIKAGDKPAKSTCVISVISNGVLVEKTVRLDITE